MFSRAKKREVTSTDLGCQASRASPGAIGRDVQSVATQRLQEGATLCTAALSPCRAAQELESVQSPCGTLCHMRASSGHKY